jgi:hypothetical protein
MNANLQQISTWARDRNPDNLSTGPEECLPEPGADHTREASGPIERHRAEHCARTR